MADLEGDLIYGDATGLTTFDTGYTTVVSDFTPEFSGTLDLLGDGNIVFNTGFYFFGNDLTIFIDHNVSGSTQYMSNFTVTLSDLNDTTFPSYVLTDVTSNFDSLGTGAGLAVNFTADSLELAFTNFEIPESRELQLSLVFDEEGDPTTPVVPVPATLPLCALGIFLAAVLKRKFA